MIIYVAGSRGFADKALLKKTLDAIHEATPISLLIEGGSITGAHRFAYYWAGSTGVRRQQLPATPLPGETHRCAQRRTNSEALDRGVNMVVAFPGGFRTRDMVAQASQRGIEVRKVDWS